MIFINCLFQRVLAHEEDNSLLREYISESEKFLAQCSYLPLPFEELEKKLQGMTYRVQKKPQEYTDVKKVNKKSPGKNYFTFIFVFLANVGPLELYNLH